ncbi:MAG: efflux RND transporter permease subunit, partial [bacterium]
MQVGNINLICRPVAVAMLMLAAAATGLYQVFHLPLEFTPEVDLPKLAVTASWPGSTPENVEAFVASPIEAIAHILPAYGESQHTAVC